VILSVRYTAPDPPPGLYPFPDMTRSLTTPRVTPSRIPCRWGVIGVALALLAGCSKPLLSPEDSRTQYDRYDRSRNQYSPQYVEDEFGDRTPNLRGRLAPKS